MTLNPARIKGFLEGIVKMLIRISRSGVGLETLPSHQTPRDAEAARTQTTHFE